MLVNKIVTFLLPIFFISTLASCEKRPVEEEQIDVLIIPVDKLEEVSNDVSIEGQTPPSEPSKELIEIDSLNKTTLELSAENDELAKKMHALTEEFNELKKALLDKINKNKESQ